eukprot:COSAG04_NODE_24589_length_319_cov_1.350000_1_plen_20_part_10
MLNEAIFALCAPPPAPSPPP